MKKYFYLAAIAVMVLAASCSKEKEDAPADLPLDGYWSGFYKINGSATKQNAAMLVRPNGTLRLYVLDHRTDTVGLSADLKVDASWTFSNNVFQYSFEAAGEDAVITLARSADQKMLNGTYTISGALTGIMEYKK